MPVPNSKRISLFVLKSTDQMLFWTPHFSVLDSTFFVLDSTFSLDSTLKIDPEQIARQHSWSTLQLDHHAKQKLVVVSHTACTHVGGPKEFGGRWYPAPRDGGVVDNLET